MRRVDHVTAARSYNGPGKDGFRSASPEIQAPSTAITPEFLNNIQEEIANAIESVGIALSGASRTQLRQAAVAASQGFGAANAVTIRGQAVSSSAPSSGDVLTWSGAAWVGSLVSAASVSPAAGISTAKLSAAGTSDYSIVSSRAGAGAWSDGVSVLAGKAVSSTQASAGQALSWGGNQLSPSAIVDENVAASAAISPARLAAPSKLQGTWGQNSVSLAVDQVQTSVDVLVPAPAAGIPAGRLQEAVFINFGGPGPAPSVSSIYRSEIRLSAHVVFGSTNMVLSPPDGVVTTDLVVRGDSGDPVNISRRYAMLVSRDVPGAWLACVVAV